MRGKACILDGMISDQRASASLEVKTASAPEDVTLFITLLIPQDLRCHPTQKQITGLRDKWRSQVVHGCWSPGDNPYAPCHADQPHPSTHTPQGSHGPSHAFSSAAMTLPLSPLGRPCMAPARQEGGALHLAQAKVTHLHDKKGRKGGARECIRVCIGSAAGN